MAVIRIVCILLPLAGIFIAIQFWLFRQADRADETLFFSFAGIFVNIILLPLFLFARAVFL